MSLVRSVQMEKIVPKGNSLKSHVGSVPHKPNEPCYKKAKREGNKGQPVYLRRDTIEAKVLSWRLLKEINITILLFQEAKWSSLGILAGSCWYIVRSFGFWGFVYQSLDLIVNHDQNVSGFFLLFFIGVNWQDPLSRGCHGCFSIHLHVAKLRLDGHVQSVPDNMNIQLQEM